MSKYASKCSTDINQFSYQNNLSSYVGFHMTSVISQSDDSSDSLLHHRVGVGLSKRCTLRFNAAVGPGFVKVKALEANRAPQGKGFVFSCRQAAREERKGAYCRVMETEGLGSSQLQKCMCPEGPLSIYN